jgi:hypothetical protein
MEIYRTETCHFKKKKELYVLLRKKNRSSLKINPIFGKYFFCNKT